MTRVRLTGRGALALAVGAALLAAGALHPALAALGLAPVALTCAVFLLAARQVPARPRRTVRPSAVRRLDPCTRTIELTAPGGRLTARFAATECLDGRDVPVRFPVLRPGGTTTAEYPVPTGRRGVLTLGPLVLTRRGPVGLVVSRTELTDLDQVRVAPRVLPVRGMPGRVRRGLVGADELVESDVDPVLRPHRPGDALRGLHWAASARAGGLVVREDAAPTRPRLAVLLDDRAASHPDPAGFEDAVEVAASLLVAAVDEGHPAHLLSAGGALDVELAAHDADLARTGLADVALAPGERDATTVPERDLDVVAAVSGPGADLAALVLEAARASVGVVLVLDAAAVPEVTARGTVLVLRAPSAEGLVDAWNAAVAR
ncbi:DUF58 domain-containing protein [Actinosynnema mirum]|uniref:Uncharacterized protein n=1 Tax=Actinosynnema mirum (strain ATCC 29888 / DSM 43827 / JCM 3225 / NBRC 14064 / NCIMB 13271 / NRRL B-12336 / IMRU 3971 / 101) TaxID=446462 RepID=C6WIH1_ACTMD|nr:DUF58 domain-containing protein [Actinosynnema mirum]ACU36214.1 protein of unknown function DUF58 [Actinosynnema mirum DSM 43827]